ncbi:gamma-glutamyl-gamma-aminobutyrate hydrolase family protein [Candidatus Ozemobacteraceae bacterium]|nr:gamma-glutamyl-gamma-aminobutyrate hydrolase family protein [Candidatus Ozemobacteraceae bacterium]
MNGSTDRGSVSGVLRVVLLLAVAFFFCRQGPVGIASSGVSDAAPRIGILSIRPLPPDSATDGDNPQLLRRYRDAVSSWGAVIIPLTPSDPASETAARLRQIDGLLIPGGDDVDPMLYGERPHPKLEKVNRVFDEFELAALKVAAEREIPVLGICRGHQIMNVFRGGTLWQDIPAQAASGSDVLHRLRNGAQSALCTHTIRLEPETIIAELLSSPTVEVNSYHHQAVKEQGDGLRVTASSADGIVEALESTSGPFFLGVQFHPEKMLPERAEFGRIFETFVDAARRYRGIEEGLR